MKHAHKVEYDEEPAEPDAPSDVHVIPVSDIRGHTVSRHCWCRPVEDIQQYNLVMHNAADGRERYETKVRKPH